MTVLQLSLAYHISYAACGTQVPGSSDNCSSVCYTACRNQGKSDCTGDVSTWNNCCYQPGMDNNDRYDPVNQRCSCDDVLDDDPSNDPYIPNPPVCMGIPGPTYIFCGEGFSNLCCATQAECQSNLIGTPTPTGTSPSASTTLFDFWRSIGRMPGPILQNMIPSDDVSVGGGGSVPQEPGATIPVGSVTPGQPTSTIAPGFPTPIPGLRFYPQCASAAYPNATWSSKTMQGCGTYCGYGCGISSAAMIYSSLGTNIKNPEEFLSMYVAPPYNASNCNLSYPLLRTLFTDNNIIVDKPSVILPEAKDLHSDVAKTLIDGYLNIGYTLLARGVVNGHAHFVWIVGKRGDYYLIMDPYWGASPQSLPPTFPMAPYDSSRYTTFILYSMLPVK